MSGKNQMEQFKKEIYLAYHQDGLIDIIIGLSLLGFGAMALLQSEMLLLGIMPFLFFAPLKNKITVPRYGFVQFPPVIRMKESSKMVIIILCTILSLGIGIGLGYAVNNVGSLNTFYELYTPLIGAGIGALILSGMGIVLKLKRLFTYAVLISGVITLGYFLNIHPGIYTNGVGILVFSYGAWLLYQFLKKYPLNDQEGSENYE